ncbi:MAG: hypothetical protein ACRD1L_05055 [Terriglobales bacterium]
MERAAQSGDRLDLLLAGARLECALADLEAEDDWEEGRRARLDFSRRAAAWYLGRGGRPDRAMLAALRQTPRSNLSVTVSTPEGLRYYALAPKGFAAAAERWRREHPQPEAVWVLGLRSMGSVLAPVVAEALARPGRGNVRCLTLRPVGPPAARQIAATVRLRRALAGWPGAFLIVDEGPGLSGSSFGGAVAFLAGLGVAESRLALLVSGSPPAERLSSPQAAAGWRRWQIYVAHPLPPPYSDGGPARELSGGAWRGVLGGLAATPVWGEHERRKFLTDRGKTLVKFAGLGSYGQQTAERARRLGAAGWGPALAPDAEAEPGWLRYRRLRARPLSARPGRSWCEFAGRYLAWVRSEYRLGPPAPPSPALGEMVAINQERMLGIDPTSEAPPGVPVALDGRMLPIEWGQVNGSWVKFDATDHGDDPFFPGPADIAWDLSALAVEFGAARGAAAAAAYRRHSGETEAALAPRLRWHGLAYALFRAAYCSFAATRVGAPDSAWFRQASRPYLVECRRRLAAH